MLGRGNQTGSTGGGLGRLLSSFQQAGSGHIAQSWVGNGPNQPVSPQQLQTVFGEDQVQTMSRQSAWRRTTSCRNSASISLAWSTA
jgi:uncharacterized protein YidB (DUF937 family)